MGAKPAGESVPFERRRLAVAGQVTELPGEIVSVAFGVVPPTTAPVTMI